MGHCSVPNTKLRISWMYSSVYIMSVIIIAITNFLNQLLLYIRLFVSLFLNFTHNQISKIYWFLTIFKCFLFFCSHYWIDWSFHEMLRTSLIISNYSKYCSKNLHFYMHGSSSVQQSHLGTRIGKHWIYFLKEEKYRQWLRKFAKIVVGQKATTDKLIYSINPIRHCLCF